MRMAATLYGLTGAALIAALLALPDPAAWRQAYTDAIREAYRQAPAVAADTFPGWHPEREALLVTRGQVNYLVQPDFTVERLKQPVIPVVANGVVAYAGRNVAVVATRADLERVLGGMAGEMELAGSGDAGLVKALLNTGATKKLTDDDYTGVILHEAFHVYQMPVLRGWKDPATDQGELWSLIYADAENNRLQNEEAQLLQAAVEAPTTEAAGASAERFLSVRNQRWTYWESRLGAAKSGALREWERRYEWQEGLATYIEWALQPARIAPEIGKPVSAMQPRERIYRLGAAQALLLDRLAPGWQAQAMTGVGLTDLLRGR